MVQHYSNRLNECTIQRVNLFSIQSKVRDTFHFPSKLNLSKLVLCRNVPIQYYNYLILFRVISSLIFPDSRLREQTSTLAMAYIK